MNNRWTGLGGEQPLGGSVGTHLCDRAELNIMSKQVTVDNRIKCMNIGVNENNMPTSRFIYHSIPTSRFKKLNFSELRKYFLIKN